MRVLLIGPTALDSGGTPIKQSRLHLPGLTLTMLAAVTPPAIELRLVYETVEDIPFEGEWDLVGLTGMGSGIVRAWRIADEFRRRGVPVVIGGIAASLIKPEWSLEHADALVIGEAEEIWPRVVEDFAAGHPQSIYRASHRPDIGSLPLPRYDLMTGPRFGFWRPVQATRGCPFTCNYCSITAFFEQGYRKRPVDQVIRDVRAAKSSGSRYIAFIDDNIGVDFDYSARLWRALIPERISFRSCDAWARHASDQPPAVSRLNPIDPADSGHLSSRRTQSPSHPSAHLGHGSNPRDAQPMIGHTATRSPRSKPFVAPGPSSSISPTIS